MNKVFLSGVIDSTPILATTAEMSTPHLTINLAVTHKNKLGIKSELYRVNAWNNAAVWAASNLQRGQQVMVEGYLTQRATPEGNQVDVTANEFFVGAGKVPEDARSMTMGDVPLFG